MIGYGLRVLGGLATAVVGMLLLIGAADRMFPAGQAPDATTTGMINRTNKGDRAPRQVATQVQEQKRIAAVEVVGIRDAAIVYRDREGRILFSTDPLANVTIVVKNVALPEVTIRDTHQSAVTILPVERARPAVPIAQPAAQPNRALSEGCEPAVSEVTAPNLAGIASRCLTAIDGKSNFASLN